MKLGSKTRIIAMFAVMAVVVASQWFVGWFFGGAIAFAGLCMVALCVPSWNPIDRKKRSMAEAHGDEDQQSPREIEVPTRSSNRSRTVDLVEDMMAQDRFALLLRPQLVGNLTARQREQAHEVFESSMALVPAGEVMMMRRAASRDDEEGAVAHPVESVAALYLDRYPVTNRQYYEFVLAGGYQQIALWYEEVLSALLEFVDETEQPGPRFWRDGTYPPGREDHPVVGVSWYEAEAYARWIGKRLPADPEWVKAASWPVARANERPLQRKFPWGESMDRGRANVWGSGPQRTVPIGDFADGVSVGGVYQMIGNVWEWTASDFGQWDEDGRWLESKDLPKSLRGGAFDTYLESQASIHFQSGDHPLARKHNVGFRCALTLSVLQAGESADQVDEARKAVS